MDLYATILEWFGCGASLEGHDGISLLPSLRDGSVLLRQLAVTRGARGRLAVRTPAWWLIESPDGIDLPQLFAKPGDRWESNDVAALCPAIHEGLAAELATVERCCDQRKALPTVPADPELISSWQ